MGNENSREANFSRLERVIPTFVDYDQDRGAKFKAFENERDRRQFIESTLSVISNNKPVSGRRDYKLLYSRTEDDQYVAQLLAISPDGVIEAKIEPDLGGDSHEKAFKAFKKHVEHMLYILLRSVPDVLHNERQTPAVAQQSSQASTNPADLPPSYEAKDNEEHTGSR